MVHSFGSSFGHTFFGELGDNTFVLTAILTAWCPWEGVRHGKDLRVQQGLVGAGAFMALAFRSLLQSMVRNPQFGGGTFNALSCGVLLLFAVKAFLNVRQPSPEEDELTVADESQSSAAIIQHGSPQQATSYSTYAVSGIDAESKSYTDHIMEHVTINILALGIPFVMCFFVESSDMSQMVALSGDIKGLGNTLGCILGFLPSVLLAVCCGIVMGTRCSPTTVATIACVASLALAIANFGQAFLYNPGLAPKPALLQLQAWWR